MILKNRIRLATVIDTEGWITIQKTNNKIGLVLQLGVGNTNPNLTDWLKSTFGGSIYHRKSQSEYRKSCYTWRIYSNTASQLLIEILPYLLIKKEQAELAIQFQSNMHGKSSALEPFSEEYQMKMVEMKKAMNKLNQKGKINDIPLKEISIDSSIEEDYIRLAMLLDCEGYIGIYKINQSLGTIIGVGNTNPNLLSWISLKFGGAVSKTIRKNYNHRNYYTWRANTKKAKRLLELIKEYLIMKEEQAILGILCETSDDFDFKKSLKARISVLNKKGIDITRNEVSEKTLDENQRCGTLNSGGNPENMAEMTMSVS